MYSSKYSKTHKKILKKTLKIKDSKIIRKSRAYNLFEMNLISCKFSKREDKLKKR